MMCQACSEGRHWDCNLATWRECECGGPYDDYSHDDPFEESLKQTHSVNTDGTLSHGRARVLFSIYTQNGRYDFCISYGWHRWHGLRVPELSFFTCHNPDAKR